jgi:anti-sigma B factor antagonist
MRPASAHRIDGRRPSSPLDGTDGFLVTQMDASSDGVRIFAVTGELDGHTAPRLKAALLTAVRAGRTAIMVDLESCPFIDSTGLAVLCHVSRMLRAPSGRPGLAATSTQPQVARVFAISHVDELVPLSASRPEALAALAPP